MDYDQLNELIENMSDEQRKMKVVVSCDGGWHEICAMTQLTFVKPAEEGEQYPLGQPILEA